MIRALIAAALALPLLGGCVVYSSEAGETTTQDVTVRVGSDDSLETLRSAAFDGARLVARVESNGCTQAADFEVLVVDGDPAEVSLRRRAPDLCKALVPDGVEVSWTYEDLGLAAGSSARIGNPLRLQP